MKRTTVTIKRGSRGFTLTPSICIRNIMHSKVAQVVIGIGACIVAVGMVVVADMIAQLIW